MFHLSFDYHIELEDKSSGFTENFWAGVDSEDGARALAKKLGLLLIPFHGVQTVLGTCRISDETGARAGVPVRFQDVSARPASATADSDYPTTAFLLELTSKDSDVTRQWFKGLPDDYVKKG